MQAEVDVHGMCHASMGIARMVSQGRMVSLHGLFLLLLQSTVLVLVALLAMGELEQMNIRMRVCTMSTWLLALAAHDSAAGTSMSIRSWIAWMGVFVIRLTWMGPS